MKPSLRWLAPALALSLMPSARSQEATPADQLAKLQQEYEQAEAAFFEPLMKAQTDEERAEVEIDWGKHPAGEYLYKFQEFADENEGTDPAARALLMVMNLAGQANAEQQARYALVELTDTYIESEVMADVAMQVRGLAYGPGAQFFVTALDTILEESPHRNAKAAALMAKGELGAMMGESDAAKALFTRLKDEFGDTPAAAAAKGWIFELENLQVGMVAPDFESTDQAGVAFKVSDYRGKVTVLDFWGFW